MAVLMAALFARLNGAGQAFVGGELVPLDGDSLYHLRRMRLLADGFPRIPWIDAGIAWPDGAPIPWAAGFDVMGALCVLLGRAAGDPSSADVWVAALCPLLGVAVVAATMNLVHDLARDLPGRRAATLTAGLLAAVIPQGLATSRFGCIDHHVAEALAMVLLARWSLAALPPRAEAGTGRRCAFEAAGAGLTAWAVWVFTGSPLYVALVVPILLVALLLAPQPRLLGSGGPGLLAGAGLAGLATAPAVEAHGRALAFGFPSWLQPILLAAAGGTVCCAALAAGSVAPGRRRIGAVLGSIAAVAILAALLHPAGAAQTWAAIREWLFKSDPWLVGIDEFQPLLGGPYGPAHGLNRFLGAVGFAAPLLLLLGFRALRGAGRVRAIAFLALCTSLALLTLLQVRFGRIFVPFLAMSGGLGLCLLVRPLAARSRLAWALPLVATLGLIVLDPSVRRGVILRDDPEPDGAVEAAFDLRRRAPGPRPGVLAPWDIANPFLVLADRPVVTTGFGPYPDPAAYEEARRAFTIGEDELLPWLARRQVGWVVAGATNLFARVEGKKATLPFTGRALSSRWLAEVPSSPLLIGGSGVPELGVRHFAHLMPVFASTRSVQGIDGGLPVLWTYEVVSGARLLGRAKPLAPVLLEVPLFVRGRRLAWRAFTRADAQGRWTLTVPVPTDLAGSSLSTRAARVQAGSDPARAVTIPETAVRSGAALELDELH